MQKLTASQKGWTGIVIALWIIALAALIFVLPRTHSAGGVTPLGEATPSGSFAATLEEMQPSSSDAVAGEMMDMRYVYGEEYTGFLPLCKEEPQELVEAKLEAAADVADEIDLDSGSNYMLLVHNSAEGVSAVDEIPGDLIDLCNGSYFDQFFSTQQAFPIHWDGDIWRFGVRVQ